MTQIRLANYSLWTSTIRERGVELMLGLISRQKLASHSCGSQTAVVHDVFWADTKVGEKGKMLPLAYSRSMTVLTTAIGT